MAVRMPTAAPWLAKPSKPLKWPLRKGQKISTQWSEVRK